MSFAVVLLLPSLLLAQSAAPSCNDLDSCRAAALEAKAREDFETFHDLAWKTIQKGRTGDPDLMEMLARAQSLSGRPGDALVMLRRLAERGIAVDARESDDFARVRALERWPDVEPLIAAAAAKSSAPVEPAAPPPSSGERVELPLPAEPVAPKAPPASAAAVVAPPRARKEPAPASRPSSRPPERRAVDPAPPGALPKAEPARTAAPSAALPGSPTARGEEAFALNESLLKPVGLGYDSASQRFIVGDAHANKLMLADEVFKHVNNLVGAATAGFGTLTALEVDGRRGDLWAASAGSAGRASLHRLQLVSGRVLATVAVPEDLGPVSIGDLAVQESGSLLIVDSTGGRILTFQSGSFRTAGRLDAPGAVSLARDGGSAYVAHAEGLSKIDLATGRLTPVQAPGDVDLRGLRRVRWHRDGLVALQAAGADTGRLVRIRLARNGTRATGLEVLDEEAPTEGAALTISRDAAYYVARSDHGPVIRRVPLR